MTITTIEGWHKKQWLAVWLIITSILLFAAHWEADRQERVRMDAFSGEVANVARLSENIITERLHDFDNILLALRSSYASEPQRLLDNIRLLRSGPLSDREVLVVLNDWEGYVIYTDAANVKPRLNMGWAAYFRYFAEGNKDGLHIAAPIFGKVTQRYTIPLVRPIFDKQGAFSGVVALSVKQDSIANFGARLQLPPVTTVTVVYNDGAVVSRSRDLASVQGKKIPPELLRKLQANNNGNFYVSNDSTGFDSEIAYRHIQGTPLIVYAEASTKSATQTVSRQRSVLMSAVGLISLAILALMAVYLKNRKIASEIITTLRRSKELEYETLTGASLDGFWIADGFGQILDVNDTICRILVYSREELLSLNVSDIEANESPEQISAHIRKFMEEGNDRFFSRHRRKDGTIIDVEVSVQYVEKPNGHFFVFSRDITARKQAEETLLLERNRAQSYLDTVETIIIALDDEAKITTINRKACQLLGYEEHELLGQNWFSKCLPQPDGMEIVYKYYLKLMTGKLESLEYNENAIVTKNGMMRQIAWHNALLRDGQGRIYGVLSAGEDITERKRAVDELKEAKEFSELTQRSAGAGSWTWDFATNQLHWSPEQYKIFGFEPVPGTPVFDMWRSAVHPDDQRVAEANIKNAIRDHCELFNEYRIIRPSGEIRWINALGRTSYNEADEPQRMSGICLDVTERKKIENIQSDLLRFASLHPDEDFFESLASYLAMVLNMDYVCIDRLHSDNLTATTMAVYHNGEFEDNVTYTLKDTPCGDVVGKEVCIFQSGVRNLFPRDVALQNLQAESYVGTTLWSFDMRPIGLIAVIGRNPLKNASFSEAVLKLVSNRAAGELERRHVEEEKHELEQQFQHTQKLESLGVLSGGIAHDFNNILAVIMGYCALTKMDYETAEKNINEIEKAAERAAGLCRQMLAYAGKAHLIKSQVNMGMIVDEMLTMLKATIPQNAAIRADLSADIPAMEGDASQLRQVVMNLVINASEAIGTEQGEVKVSLANIKVSTGKPYEDYHGKSIPPGDYVCLEVTDTGCGMDEETKWRIFEPFYTTKFSGRGLGMSAVLGIIKSHDGYLQLFSKLGHGTTFRVYLPALAIDTPEAQIMTSPVSSVPWRGSGTILLVEDEDQVRYVAKAMLEMFGFTVLEAVNGGEALELYKRRPEEITLVLTDMGMPVMDGYELFHKLKNLDPELPIIISSGFGDSEVTARIGSDNIAGMISKPYKPDQLRETLKRIVELLPNQ